MRVTFHLTGENNRDEHTVTKMTKKKRLPFYHGIIIATKSAFYCKWDNVLQCINHIKA